MYRGVIYALKRPGFAGVYSNALRSKVYRPLVCIVKNVFSKENLDGVRRGTSLFLILVEQFLVIVALYTHSQYVIKWLSFKRCRGNRHNKAIGPDEDNTCHNRPSYCQSVTECDG
jgi:hypothetical protein